MFAAAGRIRHRDCRVERRRRVVPLIAASWQAGRGSETGSQALIRRAASGADPRGTTLPAWMARSLPAEPTRSAAGGDAAAQEGWSGGRRGVLQALVPPVLAEFGVMQPAELVGVMVQPVGGALHAEPLPESRSPGTTHGASRPASGGRWCP